MSKYPQTLDAPVIDDLNGDTLVLPRLEWQRHGAAIFLDQFLVDLGFEIPRQPRPALVLSGHGEKHLALCIGANSPSQLSNYLIGPWSNIQLCQFFVETNQNVPRYS